MIQMRNILGQGKTIEKWIVNTPLVPVTRHYLSGQDAVRTPAWWLLRSVVCPYELSYPANIKLFTFIECSTQNCHFLHTVNSHCQLPSKVILPCTELYLHDLVAYSFVNCETEFSSSLDCSLSSSGFLFALISEDVIVVTEERVKGVVKPWSSPGIYTGSKDFPLCMTIMSAVYNKGEWLDINRIAKFVSVRRMESSNYSGDKWWPTHQVIQQILIDSLIGKRDLERSREVPWCGSWDEEASMLI